LAKLQKEHEARNTHHASMQERLDYIEGAIGDSADRHAKWEAMHSKLEGVSTKFAKLQKEHEARGAHQATLDERIQYLEEAVGDSQNLRVKAESAHTKLAKLQAKQEEYEGHSTRHAALKERVDYIEDLLGDSADKHAKWEAFHVNHQKEHEARTTPPCGSAWSTLRE